MKVLEPEVTYEIISDRPVFKKTFLQVGTSSARVLCYIHLVTRLPSFLLPLESKGEKHSPLLVLSIPLSCPVH